MDPISNGSESLTQSPFDIPREDVDALCASEGFRVLRSYLAKDAEYVVPLLFPFPSSARPVWNAS